MARPSEGSGASPSGGRPARRPRWRDGFAAVGAVGLATAWQCWTAVANLHWYAGLLKPTFSPRPWLAGVMSLGIAASLARAFFRVLGRPDYLPDRDAAIRLFLIGLALDALWTWLFFAGRHPRVALAAAGALTVVSISAARHFALVDRRAGLLLVPWVLAAGFAFLVDLSIARLNG